MTNRREVTLGLSMALVGLAGLPGPAAAAKKLSPQEALQALRPWAEALLTGDPAVVAKVLAPEYQILRSNGVGHDKESYLKALPKQAKLSQFSDIVATGHGDIMVIRYRIETDQTIDGTPVVGISPRISVFRRHDGRWLLSAHANFAPL